MKTHTSMRKRVVLSSMIIIGLLSAIIYFTPTPNYRDGFRSLQELQAHAANLNEYVLMDTEHSIRPVFTSYFRTLVPNWKTRIKDKLLWWPRALGLMAPPIWSATFFKHQILTLATTRQAKQYTKSVVCKITTTPETRFFIIGTLQGAFHSLVRDLTQLHARGIINDKLIVTDPNTYLIFMGDVVSRSPFNMETLSVAMKLLQLNPSNVIYIKGGHESDNYWQEYTLKPELQARAKDLDKNPIPLADDVNRFFNTLPLALYLTIPQQPNNFIRLSLPGRTANPLLLEQHFATKLIAEAGTPLTHFDISKHTSNEEGITITIPVIIRGEKKRETFQPNKGLRLLPPDTGSIAWTILSCPTPVYQRAVRFYYDVFVELCPAARLEGWTIILNNRDVRTKEPFQTSPFALITGKRIIQANKQPGASAAQTTQEAAELVTTLAEEAQGLSKEAENLKDAADAILKKLSPQKQPTQDSSPSKHTEQPKETTKPSNPETSKAVIPEQKHSSESAFEPIDKQTEKTPSDAIKPSTNS